MDDEHAAVEADRVAPESVDELPFFTEQWLDVRARGPSPRDRAKLMEKSASAGGIIKSDPPSDADREAPQ
ncbi:MAG: hypothetical protein L3K15_05445 [Thermoplasmata archaeon]|nr:hypothetical protein [Thermoplasmata archaeon]